MVEHVRWRRGLRSAACRFLFSAAALLLLGAALAGRSQAVNSTFPDPPALGVYQPAGDDVAELAALFAENGFSVTVLDDGALQRLPESGVSTLVIPPGVKFPAGARHALSEYLRSRGNLILLSPSAFDYAPGCKDPQLVTDFEEGSRTYRVVSGASADITVERVAIPGMDGVQGLEIATPRVGLGDIVVEIPVAHVRDPKWTTLCFTAKGDYNVDILYLRLIDFSGQTWLSFVELDRQWRAYAVSLADFRLRNAGPGMEDAVVDPGNVARLTIGMVRSLLWTERPGSFGIGPVSLAVDTEQDRTPTSQVLKWRVQFEHYGIRHPEWVIDPFLDAERHQGNLALRVVGAEKIIPLTTAPESFVWAVPPPVSERGREDATLLEVFRDRHDVRRIPLLEILDETGKSLGNAAEIRLLNGGYYRGSAMAVFGIEQADYGRQTELGQILVAAARYLAQTPKIRRITANTSRSVRTPFELSLEVMVSNPFGFPLEGEVTASVAGGMLEGSQAFTLRAHGIDTVRVGLGPIPAEFPILDFDWSVALNTAYGKDVVKDRVRAEETVIEAAKHMLTVQRSHEDGRFSHYFFQDIYGARAMLALGLYLQDPEVYQRNQAALGDLTGADFIRAALRFTDMLVERQREDGAFPMGYHEHRDMRFIADLGSLALGLVQMASWLDEPRATKYLEAVKKYFALRESFYISEEKAEALRQMYGDDADGIIPGTYGLGFLDMDYFTGRSWPQTRREERGPWWVLPISMGFSGGMALLGQGQEFEEVARRDALEYLRSGYSAESHFHSEGVFWLYYALDDAELREQLLSLLRRTAVPAVLSTRAYDWFELAGRAALRWLVPVYFRNFGEDTPQVRAAIVKALWEMGSKSASFSIRELGQRYPHTVYGPGVDTLRYAAFGSIWLMELIKPGSTLLKDVPPPGIVKNGLE